MSSAILTLQLPVGGRVVPLVTSTDRNTIRIFCAGVFEEFRNRECLAGDEVEAAVYRAEIERMRRVLALVTSDFLDLAEVDDGSEI